MDLKKGNGQKILIVEDTEENIIFLTTFLKKAQYEVLQARDGEEALNILKSEEGIDLVLMDIQMPVMDGIAAIKELRKRENEENSNPMYVFALTAHAMAGDEERCLEAGFDGYIAKPFRIKDILEKIDSVIKKD